MHKEKKSSETLGSLLNMGGRIRFIRTMLKLSQEDFAKKLDLESKIAIYRYEKNLRKPAMAKIAIISDLGNTMQKWVITGEVNKNSCDRLMESIKENRLTFSHVAKRLDVPIEFLQAVEKYRIQPSGPFFNRYANYFEKEKYAFTDIIIALGGIAYGVHHIADITEVVLSGIESTKETREKTMELSRYFSFFYENIVLMKLLGDLCALIKDNPGKMQKLLEIDKIMALDEARLERIHGALMAATGKNAEK